MRKSVLTLGTFDGVHRGHQQILKQVVRRAKALGAQPVALAFAMPPRHAGQPRQKAVLLTTFNEKLALLQAWGIRHIHPLVFDRKTAHTTAQDFFEKTMCQRFGAREIVVGPRLAFGKDRQGRVPLLKKMGQQAHVKVHVVHPVASGRLPVSSRRIRVLLEKGNIVAAEAALGYPYTAEGRVVSGDHRGRKLGFPTANLDVDPDKILPPGVSIVKVRLAGKPAALSRQPWKRSWTGLCNVGFRPTFTPNEKHRHCEVFLLEGPRHLYGRMLQIAFLKHLRPERRFPSSQALQKQMARDLAEGKRFRL